MVRKLILDKLEERNLKMKEVSLRMGRAHSYLYQFLKLGIPPELKERDRINLAKILDLAEDELRGPSTALPKRNYVKHNSSVENTIDHLPHHATQGSQRPLVPGDLFSGEMNLPILGTAQGGEGALIVSEQAVDWTERPRQLLRVDDAYGMIVTGDSMDPLIKAGSTVLVHPHLPPRLGDFCVFRAVTADGTQLAAIKEYRGETDTVWKVRQYNPPKDITLKKADWQKRHKVMTINLP